MNFAPSQISYDPDNNVYYIGNSQYTYVVDDNFTIIKLLSEHADGELFENQYEHINAPFSQGSTVYHGQFLSGIWLGATLTGTERGRSYARLASINYATGGAKAFYDFPLRISEEEFETVENIDGVLYLFTCRFGTLYLIAVNPIRTYLASDTAKYPYYTAITYSTNSYCTSTDTDRLRLFCVDNIGILRFNLLLSTAMPANTRNVLIGNLNVHVYDETSVIIPAQNNSGNLFVNIKTDGKIYINNVNDVSLDGFFRLNIPLILT
jgi:hypothetical protein